MNKQSAKATAAGTETAVSIENLSVYYGNTPAILGVSFHVKDGEYLGIIGPNGGGKTTLLKAILNLVPASKGTIRIYGKKPGETGGLIGYVPQYAGLDKAFPITVREVVLTGRMKPGLSPFYRFSKEDKDTADELLEKVGIAGLAVRQIASLSGGEFQKMLIARALAVRPRLLLLDEPTASIDPSSCEQIYSLLYELNKHMTIILVTHDLMAVSSQVQRLACLNRQLVYHDEAELNESVLNGLYGCPVDLIAHGVPHRVLKEHKGGHEL
ncbi:MAG: metal ABC transporter ATP-binding protein [Bacillota bacterium]